MYSFFFDAFYYGLSFKRWDHSDREGDIAITTPEEFLKLNDFEDTSYSGTYYLTGDLDFSGIEITTPYLVDEFYGVLDGRGLWYFRPSRRMGIAVIRTGT